MIFHIETEHSGRTVLSFLKAVLKISRSALAALKRDEHGILINGSHVTVRYILKEGDILSINEKDSPQNISETVLPVNIPLDVLLENEDIILVNKPPYMPTHPSHGHTDDTLANAVAHIYSTRGIPFVFRPIGRLDRNTSGISLIAKNQISASYLFYARQKGLIRKRYIAILCGRIDGAEKLQTIDSYMKRQEESIIVRCIGNADEEGAFRAITHWRVLFTCDEITVVEAIPETGRTHQLRVHFASIGHPILGDDVYGTTSEYIGRHALHAGSLSIPLPYNGEIKEFIAPPPQDMIEAFKALSGCELSEIYNQTFHFV